MGNPMAKNLIKAGYPLVVYDIVQEKVDEVVDFGAEATKSSKEVAERSNIIITMLPDSSDVEQAILGEKGVLEGAKPGSLIIDMSSIAPLVSIKIAEEAKKSNVRMMDAPVSGGEPGAIAGTLSIMVGGDTADFEEVKDILQVMGKSVVLVGPIGAGGFTKLANQILVGIHLQAMAEALTLAKKAGLDAQKVYEAIKDGLAGSNVLDAKVPIVLKGDFKPGFRIELHIKDLKNALSTGRNLKVPLPTTALVHEFFGACAAAGREKWDHGGLVTLMEDLSKVKVRAE